MDSNDKFKKNDIKNRTSYCFDDTIKFEDFDLDNFLIGMKIDFNSF